MISVREKQRDKNRETERQKTKKYLTKIQMRRIYGYSRDRKTRNIWQRYKDERGGIGSIGQKEVVPHCVVAQSDQNQCWAMPKCPPLVLVRLSMLLYCQDKSSSVVKRVFEKIKMSWFRPVASWRCDTVTQRGCHWQPRWAAVITRDFCDNVTTVTTVVWDEWK